MIDIRALVGPEMEKARDLRWQIAVDLSERFDLGHIEVACLTLLAGAGTRWVKSLTEAKAKANTETKADTHTDVGAMRVVIDFPLSAPRGLYPVKNYISRIEPQPLVPMAGYAIDAFLGLGRQIVVIRGWQDEICSQVLKPLHISCNDVSFFEQQLDVNGKVAGHGDATWQAQALWQDSDYVLVNFGGDANSPLTALASLLAMAVLVDSKEDVALLLPVARIKNPAYPVLLDDKGRPIGFGHNKLGGKTGTSASDASAQKNDAYACTNVGIRVYRASALAKAIAEIRAQYWNATRGYAIPGNDPEGHEFALDNVDALLAAQGRARVLPIARPEELTPAKSFDQIPAFEAAIATVRAEWDRFVASHAHHATARGLAPYFAKRGGEQGVPDFTL
ncbi:MAG TPA: hypothetical protein PLT87_04795 [Spirochaetales bacterium]|nr:hypothetical protein [Spirochaetales bacterium]